MIKQVAYDEAIQCKYPEPVAYAIAKDPTGKANPITLGWVMCTSHQPPMLAISVAFERHSYDAIRHSKCFTVVLPSEKQAEEALYFGTQSGRDTDKMATFGSAAIDAVKIDSVLLENAVANFECELESELVTGDHALFVGRVVASHINTEPLGRLYTLSSGWKMGGVHEKSQT